MLTFLQKENFIEKTLCRLKLENKSVVLYGAGYCGHETAMLMKKMSIPVIAVCDDFRAGENMDDYRIKSISDVRPQENMKIIVTSGFNKAMKKRLKELNLWKYYLDIDFGRYEADKENWQYFHKHEHELNRAYSLLKDSKSKDIFQRLVNYRICRNIDALDGIQDHGQYFPEEEKLNLSTSGGADVFFDLGAYDGDSIAGFVEYVHGRYKKVIAVEASEKNYKKLCSNLSGYKNVECHNVGVYSEKTKLNFTVSDAKNSFADKDGENVIEVDTVDNIVAGQPVTFIKMDIEGAEYAALQGAVNTLRDNVPVLAISIYHTVDDLWRLQLFVEDLLPGKYDFYIRHYSPTVIETILYAVPKKG